MMQSYSNESEERLFLTYGTNGYKAAISRMAETEKRDDNQ